MEKTLERFNCLRRRINRATVQLVHKSLKIQIYSLSKSQQFNDSEIKTGTGVPLVSGELSPIEEEFVRFFVQMAQAASLPRSIGEIFGLLYASEGPVPADDVVTRLGISKGSTSQGLRFLVKIGAASTAYIPRDRRTFYVAETSMRKLFGGALRETLRPHLESNRTLIAGLEKQIEIAPHLSKEAHNHYQSRVASVRGWNKKALQLLPLLETLFSISSPSSLLALLREPERAGEPSKDS